MPKDNENLKFQKKEFPKRLRAVKKSAQDTLKRGAGKGKAARAKAQEALAAVSRIEGRSGIKATPDRSAVTNPGKTKSKKKLTRQQRADKRREPLEPEVTKRLRGLRELGTLRSQ